MSEFDGIDDGETGDGGAESEAPVAEAVVAEGLSADGTCLSCGAPSVGVFCANCGQKNDDLRRSVFLLGRDFIEDTFSFDSRMWRTLGVLAAAPGLVATNFAHGKRSRYTPPVRLFLVVSFLFFLTIGLTKTMFLAVEITAKTPEQIAAQAAALEKLEELAVEEDLLEEGAEDAVIDFGDDNVITVGSDNIQCNINVAVRFFIRADAVNVDKEAWRKCAESIHASANIDVVDDGGSTDADRTQETRDAFERVMAGISTAVEEPDKFNSSINAWLPRVMFFMAPLAALMMGVFIRGRDALFFDHMVMSLYSHAVAFALAGAAIVLTQLGLPFAGIVAAIGLFIYSIKSLKQAYGRGWVKTIYSTLMVGFFYLLILLCAVIFIVVRIVLDGG